MANIHKARQALETAILGVDQDRPNKSGGVLKDTVDGLIQTSQEFNLNLNKLANRTTMLTGTADATTPAQMKAVINEMQDIFKELNKNNQTLKQGLTKVQKGVQDLGIDTSENVKPSSIRAKRP